jgi:hypothetical protein
MTRATQSSTSFVRWLTKPNRFFHAAFIALAVAATIAATGYADVVNTVDCNSICDRYRSCFDSSYNTSACYDRFRSRGHPARRPSPCRHLRGVYLRRVVHPCRVFVCVPMQQGGAVSTPPRAKAMAREDSGLRRRVNAGARESVRATRGGRRAS